MQNVKTELEKGKGQYKTAEMSDYRGRRILAQFQGRKVRLGLRCSIRLKLKFSYRPPLGRVAKALVDLGLLGLVWSTDSSGTKFGLKAKNSRGTQSKESR